MVLNDAFHFAWKKLAGDDPGRTSPLGKGRPASRKDLPPVPESARAAYADAVLLAWRHLFMPPSRLSAPRNQSGVGAQTSPDWRGRYVSMSVAGEVANFIQRGTPPALDRRVRSPVGLRVYAHNNDALEACFPMSN